MSYKDDQRKARESIRKVTPLEMNLMDNDKPLHKEDGSLTLEGMLALKAASNSPAFHHTVNLNIKGFKRYLRTIPLLTKGKFNALVREYKDKAWQDYAELVEFKGSFPTLPIR